MNTYYHIHNDPDCGWKEGNELYIGGEHNRYWRSFLEKGAYINLIGERRPADQVIKYALNAYAYNEPVPPLMKGYRFNPVYTLKEATDCLGESMRIVRELTFESIRKEYYPGLPSRHNCIWLTPDDKRSLEFWKPAVHGVTKRVFRVTTDGIVHRAANKWLITGTIPLNEIYSLAHEYWKGTDAGGIEDEVLFTGKLKIIEELNET